MAAAVLINEKAMKKSLKKLIEWEKNLSFDDAEKDFLSDNARSVILSFGISKFICL